MKNAKKAVLLLTLCLMLMMSIATMVGAEVTYDALDLSGTAVTVLDLTDASVDNNTTKIVVKGVTEGVVGDEITTGVTFTSSDQSVATVSSDGTVTAVDEGATVITVTYGELTKGIVIMVGEAKQTLDYESGSITKNLTGANDGIANAYYYSSTWKNAQEITSTKARTGNQSVQFNQLFRAPNDKAGNYTAGRQLPIYVVYDVAEEDRTVDSVQSVWFYDDGTESKEVQIGFAAPKTTGADALTTRYNFCIYLKNDTYTSDGDNYSHGTVDTTITRSIGWHQAASVGTSSGFTIYIDGQQFANIPKTNLTQYCLNINRNIPKTADDVTPSGSDTANHALWIDDFAYVDTTKREPAVASFDLSKTENTILCLTDEDVSNDTTQLKARGFRADGIEIENAVVEGLTYSSNNTAVATVSESGLVTAVNEGVAVITATNGTVSKNVVIVVGDTKMSKNFESASDWEDKTGKAVVNNEMLRASEKSLKLFSNGGNGTTEKIYILGVEGNTSNPDVIPADANTISYWFYDKGKTNSGSFGTTGWRSPRNSFNFCLGHYIEKTDGTINQCKGYGFHGDLTPITSGMSGINPYTRSKGWHQVVITSYYVPQVVDGVEVKALNTTMYMDGNIILKGTTTQTLDSSKDHQLFTNFYYSSVADTTEKLVYLDDVAAIDVSDKKAAVIVTYDNTNGAVKVGEETVVSGEALSVEYGEDLTLTFAPNEGYEAKVEGYTVTNNQLTLENIKADTALNVTFEEVIITPSITGNGDEGYLFKETNYNNSGKPAYVSFYKVTVPAGYELKAKGYGMYLNGMQLIAEGKNEDNMFGIRVYGAAINDTDSYEFKGFATLVKDEQETIVETTVAGSEDAVSGQ